MSFLSKIDMDTWLSHLRKLKRFGVFLRMEHVVTTVNSLDEVMERIHLPFFTTLSIPPNQNGLMSMLGNGTVHVKP